MVLVVGVKVAATVSSIAYHPKGNSLDLVSARGVVVEKVEESHDVVPVVRVM